MTDEKKLTNLDYDIEKFDEANDRAAKLLEVRIKQNSILTGGNENGKTNID